MKNFIPWIAEDDIIYSFGIRKSAFTFMKECGINKAFFTVQPSTYIADGFMCETIASVKEISEYCKQFGIEPMFSFSISWYDLTPVQVIPKTFNALRMFLKFLDESSVEDVGYHHISSMLKEHREEFLLGENRHYFHASKQWYNPFDSSKAVRLHEEEDGNSNQTDNDMISPCNFFFDDYICDSELDLDFYKKCKKISMPFIVSQKMFSSGSHIKLFSCTAPEEIIENIGKIDRNFADYTLFYSAEQLAEKIENYDALDIIDSIY